MALPDIQLSLRPGIVEFGWGHPDAALLPTADLARAATYALETAGAEALAYGAEQGPGRLIEAIRQRLAQTEGDVPPEDHFLISGGISQALEMLCVQLTRPGDVVLVGEPSYHLAQKIFRDHGLQLVGVPSDAQGLHVEAIDALLTMLRRRGERVALVYHVPTFNNPSGATLTPDRRYALAALARREGLLMIEDDAYAELWYDAPPPPPVYNFAPGGPIIRLGSFAKSLAPGLRLGWVQADPQIVQRCVAGGLLDSGGGVNHFTAHVAAAFLNWICTQHMCNACGPPTASAATSCWRRWPAICRRLVSGSRRWADSSSGSVCPNNSIRRNSCLPPKQQVLPIYPARDSFPPAADTITCAFRLACCRPTNSNSAPAGWAIWSVGNTPEPLTASLNRWANVL